MMCDTVDANVFRRQHVPSWYGVIRVTRVHVEKQDLRPVRRSGRVLDLRPGNNRKTAIGFCGIRIFIARSAITRSVQKIPVNIPALKHTRVYMITSTRERTFERARPSPPWRKRFQTGKKQSCLLVIYCFDWRTQHVSYTTARVPCNYTGRVTYDFWQRTLTGVLGETKNSFPRHRAAVIRRGFESTTCFFVCVVVVREHDHNTIAPDRTVVTSTRALPAGGGGFQ